MKIICLIDSMGSGGRKDKWYILNGLMQKGYNVDSRFT